MVLLASLAPNEEATVPEAVLPDGTNDMSTLSTLFGHATVTRLRNDHSRRLRDSLERLEARDLWRVIPGGEPPVGEIALRLEGDIRRWVEADGRRGITTGSGGRGAPARDVPITQFDGPSLAGRLAETLEDACHWIDRQQEHQLCAARDDDSTKLDAVFWLVERCVEGITEIELSVRRNCDSIPLSRLAGESRAAQA